MKHGQTKTDQSSLADIFDGARIKVAEKILRSNSLVSCAKTAGDRIDAVFASENKNVVNTRLNPANPADSFCNCALFPDKCPHVPALVMHIAKFATDLRAIGSKNRRPDFNALISRNPDELYSQARIRDKDAFLKINFEELPHLPS